MNDEDHGHGSEHGGPGDHAQHAAPDHPIHDRHGALGGLSIAANGVRLVPSAVRFDLDVDHTFAFEIRDEDDIIVTEFERTHGELCHLIVIRRDLTRFQHLHPGLDADGTWAQRISFPDPGVYRAFVDVRTHGRTTTLGTDLFVPGPFEFDSRPTSTREATADGYVLTLLPDDIQAGEDVMLAFEIRRADGQPAHLHEYLEALGHVVGLREGDLGYLHVHPDATAPEDGVVRFRARFPTPGRYRLFLQAKPDGTLITAQFDVHV